MSEKRLAVITGASSGIGAMFARKLAARGYDLLLIARREDRLRSLADELAETYHVTAGVMSADLAADADLRRSKGRLRELPDLGLLVNNAGFGTQGYFCGRRYRGAGADASAACDRDDAADACGAGKSDPA